MKEAAYKGMVRPILAYGSSICDPHPDKLQEELEKVQNRAARFVTRNYVSGPRGRVGKVAVFQRS